MSSSEHQHTPIEENSCKIKSSWKPLHRGIAWVIGLGLISGLAIFMWVSVERVQEAAARAD